VTETRPKPLEGQAADAPAGALAAVLENATALARAEVRLAAAEARAWLLRIGVGLAVLWLSLLSLQVFVLLAALAPALYRSSGGSIVVAAWAPGFALLVALASLAFGVRELRQAKASNRDTPDGEKLHGN
jgi:hypothetical protein